jgi:RNA polymerase sigma-70 factor (ECF subfamily)
MDARTGGGHHVWEVAAADNRSNRFYAELWPHRASVLRAARFLTHNDDDADDLAQEAMLKAFDAIDRLAPGSNAKAWLMTILRNAHIDRIRSQHNDVSLESLDVNLAADPTREDTGFWGDPARTFAEFSDQQIIEALKSLPQEICWTLLLVDVEGLDDRDAAGVLKIPSGTVKSRLHRGRRMLREALLPRAKKFSGR